MSNFIVQRFHGTDDDAPRAAGSANTLLDAKQRMLAAAFRETDRLVNGEHVSVRVEVEPLSATLFSLVSSTRLARYAVVVTEPVFEEVTS